MTTSIRLSIQKPAKRVGIRNGKDLADATGLSLNTSYDLWNERSTRIDLSTIATLCRVFKCEVSTVLVKPDKGANPNKMDTLTKRKRGRPRKDAATDSDGQEPISNYQRAPDADNGEEDSESLSDPALFEEMNQTRNAKLENKGRKWITQDDLAKREKVKADDMADEIMLIMRALNINTYSYGDLHLVISSGKAKLKGELG